MKVVVIGAGNDKALIDAVLRIASIAKCEVVYSDEPQTLQEGDIFIGDDMAKRLDDFNILICEDSPMCPTETMLLTANAVLDLPTVAIDVNHGRDYTPHYAKKTKRSKFKRSGK